MIDTHCHILPGLDDGPETLETSLAMARMAARDGVRIVIATPHTNLDDGYPSPEVVRERVAALNEAIRAEGIDLSVVPGAEITVTDRLTEHLEAGRVMTMGDRGKHLLIELPFNSFPNFIPDLFFSIQLMGFVPIIAHPERSGAARIRLDTIRELAQRGALLQVNMENVTRGGLLEMLSGSAPDSPRSLVRKLLQEDLVDFIGSDGHDPQRRRPVLTPARAGLKRFGGDGAFQRLTQSGPARLLRHPKQPGRVAPTADSPPA